MAANEERLREFVRSTLPGKSDDELRQMEHDGTLVKALRESVEATRSQGGMQSVTPESIQDLTKGMRTYGLQGLSPSQVVATAKMPQVMLERYAKASAFEQAASQSTGYVSRLKPFAEIASEPYKGVKGGFMWALDVVDRFTQDWAFAVADEMIKGNTSPEDVWKRVKGVLKGEEQVEFAQLLDHLSPEHKRSLAEGLLSAKIAFQDAPLPSSLQGLDPILESILPGRKSGDVTWEDARKVYGFIPDMVLDLSILGGGASMLLKAGAGAAKGTKLTKGLTAAAYVADPMRAVQMVGGKASEAALREMSKHDRLNRALRSTFVRGTGIKEFDDAISDVASLDPYLRDMLLRRASEVDKAIAPFRKEGYGIQMLSQERSFDLVKSLSRDVADGRTSVDDLAKTGIFDDFETFSNPKAAKDAIEKLSKKPDLTDDLEDAVSTYRDFSEETRNIRIEYGVNPNTLGRLGGNMEKRMADLKAKHRQAYKDAFRNAQEEVGRLRDETRAAIDQNRIQILEAGERGTKSLLETARIQSKVTLEDFNRSYKEQFTDVVAQSILDNQALKPAMEYLDDLYMSKRFLRGRAKNNPMVLAVDKEILDLEAAIAKNPNYAPFVITKEGLRAIERFAPESTPGARLNPQEASDIVRKWIEKETTRPLSQEEVEKIVRDKLWKYSGQEGPLTKGSDVDAFEAGPLLKSEHIGGKIIRRIRNKDRELATLFEVDERTIMVSRSHDTARSASAANYFRQLITPDSPYIRTAEDVKKMSPEKQLAWTKLIDADGGRQVLAKMPELNNVYVSRRALRPMLDAAKPFITDPREHMWMKSADALKKWWISYTLPLYPAYHSRNSIGNKFNMMMAGWMTDPRYSIADLTSARKSHHLQFLLQRGDYKGAKNITFDVKGFPEGLSGERLQKVAARMGVLDGGFLSREVEDLFKMEGFASNWRRWVPGDPNFGLVKYGREAGKWIENSDRLALFTSQLARGKSFEEAAAITKKFLGNYQSLVMTPFERKNLTRIFPFYRWTRFNVPLQFEQLFFNPMHRYRMASLRRWHESGALGGIGFEEPPGIENGMIPEWASPFLHDIGVVPTSFNSESGEVEFKGAEGFIPAADIVNILGGIDSADSILRFGLQMSNPIIKAVGESAFGVPSFGALTPFEGRTQEFLGKEMSSRTVSLLRNLRFLNELDRMDPFAPFVGPNSVWRFHKRRQQIDNEEKALRVLLGIGTYKATPNAEILKMRYDQLEEMSKRQSAALRNIQERSAALRALEEYEEDMIKKQSEAQE